jgi:hypothetical protein
MILLKIKFTTKHITIYLIKNKITFLTLSTNTFFIKNKLYRTNNISAILLLSKLLVKELKLSGIDEPICFECKQFKGKIIFFIESLINSKIPISVKLNKI